MFGVASVSMFDRLIRMGREFGLARCCDFRSERSGVLRGLIPRLKRDGLVTRKEVKK